MELYFRFMMTLAFGLVGLSVVLKVLLDGIFSEWDAFADLGDWLKGVSEGKGLVRTDRAEDIMLEIEKSKAPTMNTRLLDQKREQLKEINQVEHRLKMPNQPVVLAPLPPPAAEPASVAGSDWSLGNP